MSTSGYRRGSIFWALSLIAVGVIFLLQNFNPAIHPWRIIGKFWPVLIIFWGLSKLIDYVHARANPESATPPLFSVSEVVLLLLFLLLGSMISRIVLHRWPSSFGFDVNDEEIADLFRDSFTYTQTISLPVNAQPRLLIVNRRGDVEVRASGRSALEAVVKKTIRAENEGAANKLSKELKVEFVEQAGRYVLETNLDSLPHSQASLRLDLSLQVPKATSAEITAERGDVAIDGLKGDQNLTARHGDARVSNVEGLVRIQKSDESTVVRGVKGNVELEGRGKDVEVADAAGTVTVNGDFSGAVTFRNVSQTLRYNSSRTNFILQRLSGRLTMELGSLDASGIAGPFELSTRQKDITLEDFRHSVKISDNNGSVQLRAAVAPVHPIEVDLKKGDIEVALPPNCNFQIDASSSHGEVDSEFSGLKITKQGDVHSISGSYGKGGPTIHLSTSYGTIRLNRLGPHPPSTPPSSGNSDGGEKRAFASPRAAGVRPRRIALH